jgi:hypothetical protein
LFRVPSSGGNPQPVTELKPGELTHRWPQVLAWGQVHRVHRQQWC